MNCGRESCVCPVIKEGISMHSSLKMGSSIFICLASGPKSRVHYVRLDRCWVGMGVGARGLTKRDSTDEIRWCDCPIELTVMIDGAIESRLPRSAMVPAPRRTTVSCEYEMFHRRVRGCYVIIYIKRERERKVE